MKLTDIQHCIAHIEAQLRNPEIQEKTTRRSIPTQPLEVPETLEWEVDWVHPPHEALRLSVEFKYGSQVNGRQDRARVYALLNKYGPKIDGSWHLRINHEDYDRYADRLPESFAQPSKAA